MEILLAILCTALIFCLYRLLFSRLLSLGQTGTVPVFAVVPAAGDGEGLEQTLRHLTWLKREKLSRFTVLVVDAGLTPEGLTLVRALGKQDPSLLFCPAEEATLVLQRKDEHGYVSL